MHQKIIEQTITFSKNYHKEDPSGHDSSHVIRVYENACLLLKETQKADHFIVKMSALLHDIDDHKLNTDGLQTQKYLESLRLEPNIIQKILQTIAGVSFSKGFKKNLTLEQKIVSDADKLDAMGAIGVCRAIMFSSIKNRPLFDPDIFPKENLTPDEYNDLTRKENNTINHFFDKLLKLKNLIHTETGKKEALKRHEFLITFLENFFLEQNQTQWLNYLHSYLKEEAKNEKNN